MQKHIVSRGKLTRYLYKINYMKRYN